MAARGGRSRRAILVLTVVAALFDGTAGASVTEPAVAGAENADLWFVELTSPPSTDGTDVETLARERAAFRTAAERSNVRLQERASYQTLWNGLSVAIHPADLSRLARLKGVRALYPVVTVAAPETRPLDSPELATALAMTGADVARSDLGYTGAGVRVAVMDTGMDYNHPDLGGCFGPGCRVAVGWDFVGDAFNANRTSPAYNPMPVPDPDPDDCGGHGTHVAGIVGANGSAVGVAPSVTFGAYRVFGCVGSTTSDIMLAAMERVLADGMHVLNMSIGSAFQWPQYPTAQGSDRLVNKGVTVVASIGNSGANGLYSAGSPGLGAKVIGVAAYDNTHVQLRKFTISPDDMPIGYILATAAPAPPPSDSLSMARTGTSLSTADACLPLPAGSLAGTSALIRRGTCPFHTKALNAQNAGASAVVLYNNVAGRFGATVVGTPAITIPVVTISDTEGVLINDRLAAGGVTMTWTAQTATFPNATGGLISSFSSYGMSPDLDLKPDIGAPGGLIRSTFPLELGGYATLSGTSMSSPHVAGGVALLLQAAPRTPAQAVRGILQNSADPAPWRGNPALGFLDNVHRQGAGMLDIPGAILATTSLSPAKLALGESEAGPATRTLTFRNDGPVARTYTLSHAPALSTGPNTYVPSFSTGFADVAFSLPSLSVSPGASAAVDVTITANSALTDRSLYGGYIVATGDNNEVVRVPYAGFKGDYQSITALTPTASGLPWLAQLVGDSFSKQPGGATFTLAGDDVPYFLVHLDHQARRLRMTVRDAVSGRSWHRALDLEYMGRNSSPTGFFAFSWDGVTTKGQGMPITVPNGQYEVVVEVTKALGDHTNPAHVETWTSPMITLARP